MEDDIPPERPPEYEYLGLLTSVGIIALGNIIKLKESHIGNFTQGFGIGFALGTVAHVADTIYPSRIPHHDLLALIGLPIIFALDKTGTIKNATIIDNLYGIDIGLLTQHLVTEGCSTCGTYFCKNNEELC